MLTVILVCAMIPASVYGFTATFTVDGEDYDTVEFEGESRITPPADPEKEGYMFAGWTMEDGARAYKESTKLSGDVTIEARFLKNYVFEAENTQLTDLDEDDLTADYGNKIGYGYSNNVSGLQLIAAEGDAQCDASNGYYVTSLYYNGAYLEWHITSDKAVEDAVLTLRLSCEYYDMPLTCKNFLVVVNDEELTYEDITLAGAITDMSSLQKRAFTDHIVSKEIKLVEGENVIRLQVNNSQKQGTTGTMNAIAPMIDCITVSTDATLTWSPFANGLS